MKNPETLHDLGLAWLKEDKNPPCPKATELGLKLVHALREERGILLLADQNKALQLSDSGQCCSIKVLDIIPNRELSKEIQDYRLLEPIPEYGDLMTLTEFLEHVRTGFFIDDDGCGSFALESGMSPESLPTLSDPDELQRQGEEDGWTHVVWFNK